MAWVVTGSSFFLSKKGQRLIATSRCYKRNKEQRLKNRSKMMLIYRVSKYVDKQLKSDHEMTQREQTAIISYGELILEGRYSLYFYAFNP